MWDSIISVLSGPLLAKLALAGGLIAFFVFLRKKDTEGSMTGYAFIVSFLAARDILFVFVADPRLFNISDLVLFGGMLFCASSPSGSAGHIGRASPSNALPSSSSP